MTSTTTSLPTACSAGASFAELLQCNAGSATNSSGQSFYTLIASIYTAAASFGIQLLVFVILRMRLSRIYRPKSYLVAERERVPIPPSGIYQWILPMFTTSNNTIIQRCGLDAYFFLRFLRMQLKIFIPLAAVIIPILLPINQLSGNGSVKGVDQLGWQNVSSAHTHRFWAHLILSLIAIAWVLYVVYTELRGYIRIRQAYLTSPQHRLRASATTVLVSGIPRKWLTLEALNGLYDVFPGGIRNIWINRNFDELAEKVSDRDSIAHSLENAETSLIRNCVQKHKDATKKKAKADGKAKKTKAEKEQDRIDANQEAEDIAHGQGTSSGDPHNIPHNVHEAVQEIDHEEHGKDPSTQRYFKDPFNKIGEGIGAFGHGIINLPHAGKKFVGDVTGDVNRAIHSVNNTVDRTVQAANSGPGFGAGFVLDDEESYRTPPRSRPERQSLAAPITPPDHRSTGLRKPDDVAVMERDPPSYLSPVAPTVMASSPISTHSDAPLDSPAQYSSTSTTGPTVHKKEQPTSKPHGVRAYLAKHKKADALAFPSPQPHVVEEDEFPLHDLGHPKHRDLAENPDQEISKSKWAYKFSWLAFWRKNNDNDEEEKEFYPQAINEEIAEDQDGEPVWKQYMDPKDRDTLRQPLFNKSWFPRLPFVGKEIDKIYYLRKELARLNLEIEQDQQNVEKFPFMNSAFIQFNHQVAAHMACQSLSHHVPHHMTPRIVEISPSDVLWENMSMKWWERYIRTAVAFGVFVALTVLYAIPVTFTGFLSQINYIATLFPWLDWLERLPKMVKAIIQGILPPVILSVILALIPIILRLLVKQRGVPTGSDGERGLQTYYFVFLFVQVFLIVTLSSGIVDTVTEFTQDTLSIPETLAKQLPNASDYFFSYLTVQALNNSASSLLQVVSLLVWFLWAPIVDNTAREKWTRQTKLKRVRWGSFFPPFTNFAVIGIIFSTIAPLIMVFNLIVFSVYWVAQRYNVIYVYRFQLDTGGLLFPTAVNQLFVGIYTLEICLIGLFLLVRDESQNAAAIPQAVIMIVALVCTALYQWLLNDAFRPLFRYLPITLEDDAVIRDEEFARAQNERFSRLNADDGDDIQSVLEDQERDADEEEKRAIEEERRRIRDFKRNSRNTHSFSPNPSVANSPRVMDTKPTKPSNGDRWRQVKNLSRPIGNLRNNGDRPRRHSASPPPMGDHKLRHTATDVNPQSVHVEPESQKAVGDVLYSGFSDELEDLTPEERDALIRYSFQHSALRARRPVIWIPRDALGISDDEIERCKRMSTVERVDAETEKREMKTHIWMSNEGTALDAKGRVVFRRSPPDFANVDLIAL